MPTDTTPQPGVRVPDQRAVGGLVAFGGVGARDRLVHDVE